MDAGDHPVKKPSKRKIQTAVRLQRNVVERLDAQIKKLSRPGYRPNRSDLIRLALETGLAVIEDGENGAAVREAVRGRGL